MGFMLVLHYVTCNSIMKWLIVIVAVVALSKNVITVSTIKRIATPTPTPTPTTTTKTPTPTTPTSTIIIKVTNNINSN